jgi:DNA-binding NarL/FixJ family response regulator
MNAPASGSRARIRVLVADSNQTQSQLLSSALRRHAALKVTCCHGELADCLQAVASAPVDVLLLGDGPASHEQLLTTLRGLHNIHPRIGIVLLLDAYDRGLVVNALRAGARGLFCRAREPFRALCRCITVVHSGQFWANTEQMEYMVEALSSSAPSRVVNAKGEGLLTARENQVVNLVAEGAGNREISSHLGITENTVKKSLLRIYDKLGVSNRVELVLYALTHRATQANPEIVAPRARLGERETIQCVDPNQVNLASDSRSVNRTN